MWHVEILRGSARTFHERELPAVIEPTVWWFEVDVPAIVLGSSEPIEHVDLDACRRADVEVVRRRSGGGSVLLEPGDAMWIDILLPRADPLWIDDIGRSAWWLGEAFQRALAAHGIEGTTIHRGPLQTSEWSSRVCFAGTGGGEVVIGDRKVVGISQRRARAGARYQCVVYRRWRPERQLVLLSPPAPTLDEVNGLTYEVDVSSEALLASLTAALPPR